MSKPVLVLVTAQTCGHCQSLKLSWPGIKDGLQSSGIFSDIVHYDLKAMGIPLKDAPALSKVVTHYPFFALVSASSWSKRGDPNATLNVSVYTPSSADGMSAHAIISWASHTGAHTRRVQQSRSLKRQNT